MKIGLHYFDGCPSWQAGLENLNSALQAYGVELWNKQRDIYPQPFKLINAPPCQSLPRQLEFQAKQNAGIKNILSQSLEGKRLKRSNSQLVSVGRKLSTARPILIGIG